MAIDRDATLKKAEKYLRQGRLDGAITEYVRVVKEYPRDWKTINILGDLFVRANQVESAVEQYSRIAEHLATEGFLSKAAAVYKKIVKIKPDDERALLRSAEIFEQQGLLAEARSVLRNIAEQRQRRGDRRGAAEIVLRIGHLDTADIEAGLAGARAAVELGEVPKAIAKYKAVAAVLMERGRVAEGRAALAEVAKLDPSDAEAREHVWQAFVESGDIDRAREYATTSTHFKTVAVELAAMGREEEAVEALASAFDLDPADADTRTRLARSYVSRGDLERGRDCLLREPGADAPELKIILAEIELRTGRLDEGRSLLDAVLDADPGRRQELVLLGCSLCESTPDGAFHCIDAATSAAVEESDWPSAASALHEFVTRVPNHIPALMKLVEICVDGGLEATMYSAQAQLADAYLTSGRPNEARVIAEDLVAREPWERANLERFRRALTMLGEPDPDAVIAERLSGDSPFLSTDFTLDLESPDGLASDLTEVSSEDQPGGFELVEEPDTKDVAARPGSLAEAVATSPETEVRLEPAPPPGSSRPADGGEPAGEYEIDLTDALGEGVTDLEEVFEGLRGEAVSSGEDIAAQHFRAAMTFQNHGLIEESLKEFELAARSPRYRFEAASRLARAAQLQGRTRDAVEWFERAAEAPSPSAEASRSLLYDLGQTLAEAGETARALAVFLELQADSPDYRDVAAQVERLRVLSRE